MSRRFHTLDVFTTRRFAGNPLAVVLDSEGLDTAAMLAIAREFNLSETVFVTAPRDPVNSAAVRIFTPGGELPFAGHPTIGTAVLLGELRAPEMVAGTGIVIALEEAIGLVKVEVTRGKPGAPRAIFDLPRLPERLDLAIDAGAVADALGLAAADLGFASHGISVWSAGVPYVMVPVSSLEAIGRAHVADMRAWSAAFGATGKGAAFVYTRETTEEAHHIHARMFSPMLGIPEDPATGSAAAAFAGTAVAFERPGDGLHQLIIEQGYEMGRPSQITLEIAVSGGFLHGARVGGNAVRMSEGTLEA